MPLHADLSEGTAQASAPDVRSKSQSRTGPASAARATAGHKLETYSYRYARPTKETRSLEKRRRGELISRETERGDISVEREELQAMCTEKLKRLIKMRRDNGPQVFQQMLTGTGRTDYLKLFNELVDQETNKDSFKINNDKLNEFFDTEEGCDQYVEMLRDDLDEIKFARGITAMISQLAPEIAGSRERSLTLRFGGAGREGIRGVRDILDRRMGRPHGRGRGLLGGRIQTFGGAAGATAAVSTVVGLSAAALTGNPLIGAIVGAATAGGIAGGSEFVRNGETLEIKITPEALFAVLGDPRSPDTSTRAMNAGFRQWLHGFHGLGDDFTAIQRMTGGYMRVDNSGGAQSTMLPDADVEQNILGLDRLIRGYQSKRRVRSENLESGASDWFLRPGLFTDPRRPDAPPSTGSPYDGDVWKQFKQDLRDLSVLPVGLPGGAVPVGTIAYEDGIYDRRGRPMRIAYGIDTNNNYLYTRNPQFNIDGVGVDTSRCIRLYREARRVVRERALDNLFDDMATGKIDFHDRLVTMVHQVQEASKPGGVRANALKAELTELETTLREDSEKVGGERETITTFRTKVKELTDAITEAETQRRGLEGKVTGIVDASGTSIAAPTSPQITAALSRALADPAGATGFSITIGSETITGSLFTESETLQRLVEDAYNSHPAVTAGILTAAAGGTGKAAENARQALADIRKEAKERYADRYKSLEGRRKLITDLQEQLRTANSTITAAQDKLNGIQSSEIPRAGAQKAIRDAETAFTRIQTWSSAGPPPVDLSAAAIQALARQQNGYGILMQRINAAHERNIAHGWTADESLDKSSRDMVLHAFTEARFQNWLATYTPPTGSLFGTMYPALGIDLTTFHSLTAGEIHTRLGGSGGPYTIDQVRIAKREAGDRIEARQHAAEQTVGDIRRREGVRKQELSIIDTKGAPTHLHDAIESFTRNYGELRETLPLASTQLDILFSRDIIPNDDVNYADYERGYPRGYVEMLRKLFKNSEKDGEVAYGSYTGSRAAFERNREVFTQEQYREELLRRLNLDAEVEVPGGSGNFVPIDTGGIRGITLDHALQLLQVGIGLQENIDVGLQDLIVRRSVLAIAADRGAPPAIAAAVAAAVMPQIVAARGAGVTRTAIATLAANPAVAPVIAAGAGAAAVQAAATAAGATLAEAIAVANVSQAAIGAGAPPVEAAIITGADYRLTRRNDIDRYELARFASEGLFRHFNRVAERQT